MGILKEKIEKYKAMLEPRLAAVRGDDALLSGLYDAELYSLLAGGKRIRPILTLAFCELFGGDAEGALDYAVAVEMAHTASLIHDDLPGIDNDSMRRGRATNHIVFGEAAAILAGDGLFIDSFGKIASNPYHDASVNLDAVRIFAEALGTRGLVGGEYIDVFAEGRKISREELATMDAMKTGRLIRVAAMLGALSAGVPLDDVRMRDCIEYSEKIGLCFQIVDDILDKVGDSDKLGKNVGQDEREDKTTYLSFMAVDEAISVARGLTDGAIRAVEKYPSSEFLTELAEYLSYRDN